MDRQEAVTPASWGERIRWIVDTFEQGNATARRVAMAEKIGMSAEAVRLLYKGTSTPSGDTLAAIAREYPRVNPEWLISGVGPRERPAEDVASAFAAGRLEGARRIFEFVTKEWMQAKREAHGEITEAAEERPAGGERPRAGRRGGKVG